MYLRATVLASILSLSASFTTPASAHYDNCTIWNGGFCKQAHHIRHHSPQAIHRAPWQAPVGSLGNPYNPYWQGSTWPQYPAIGVGYPAVGYPTIGYPLPGVGVGCGGWHSANICTYPPLY